MIQRKQRGGVMVQALVILAGLVALMATLAADQNATLQASQDRLRTRRAEAAARSAVAQALAQIQNADPNRVTRDDDWAALGSNGTIAYEMGDEAGSTFRVELIDANSRVNVNDAAEEQLNLLPLTPDQVATLLDWRETGNQPRPTGAKDEFYNELQTPYNTRLGRLTTTSELLLIRDWTARDLYSTATTSQITTGATAPFQREDGSALPLIEGLTAVNGAPNTQSDGSARINLGQGRPNEATLTQFGVPADVAQQIAQGGPYTTMQDVLSVPGITADAAQRLLEAVTVTAGTRVEGKLNLNTVSQAVLGTIPGLTNDAISAIITRQTGGGFLTLGDLATIPGMAGAQLAQVADYFTVGSDTWIVRAYGESGGVGAAIEATIGIRNGKVLVVNWEKLPDSGIPSWWAWPIEPDTTEDAASAATSAGNASGATLP